MGRPFRNQNELLVEKESRREPKSAVPVIRSARESITSHQTSGMCKKPGNSWGTHPMPATNAGGGLGEERSMSILVSAGGPKSRKRGGYVTQLLTTSSRVVKLRHWVRFQNCKRKTDAFFHAPIGQETNGGPQGKKQDADGRGRSKRASTKPGEIQPGPASAQIKGKKRVEIKSTGLSVRY